MADTNLSGAPVLSTIDSRKERRSLGVGIPYADAYNQSAMAKYNNEYNYWLWQQQQEYNSPSAQKARLEAAGLNPNYNSVDSGNISSLPSSSGNISPSISSGIKNSVANATQLVNLVSANIAQGIKNVSELSGIPDDIGTYRKLLNMTARGKLTSQELDNALKNIQKVYNAWNYLGVDVGGMYPTHNLDSEGGQIMEYTNIPNSPAGRQSQLRNESMELLNAIRDFDLTNIKPQDEELIKARVREVSARAGLTEKQLRWFEGLKGAQIGLGLLTLLK